MISDREWRFLESIVFGVLFVGGLALLSRLYMRGRSETAFGLKLWIKTIAFFSGGALILNSATGLLFALNVFESGPLLLSLAIAMILLTAALARFLALRLRTIDRDAEPGS